MIFFIQKTYVLHAFLAQRGLERGLVKSRHGLVKLHFRYQARYFGENEASLRPRWYLQFPCYTPLVQMRANYSTVWLRLWNNVGIIWLTLVFDHILVQKHLRFKIFRFHLQLVLSWGILMSSPIRATGPGTMLKETLSSLHDVISRQLKFY